MELRDEAPRPFRWDVGKRHQLGTLLDGPSAHSYEGFLDDLLHAAARVIAFSGYTFLSDAQPKVSTSFPPWRWGTEDVLVPNRDPTTLEALRFAAALFDYGTQRPARMQFAALLAEQPAMRHRWFRSLVQELKC